MEQIQNLEIVNPNHAWVVSEFERLYAQWRTWKDQVDAIVDQPYNRNTQSAVFADGREMMLKHDVLQAKTLTFLNNNIRGHGFITGFDGQHIDRTDLRLRIRVEHRMRELEVLRETLSAGYARLAERTAPQENVGLYSATLSVVAEKVAKHWLFSLASLCAAVAIATWALAQQLLIGPRDFEISRLKDALAESQANLRLSGNGTHDSEESRVLLSYVGLATGDSVTTPDGACTVRLASLAGETANLEVTVEAEKPRLIVDAKIGRRTLAQGKTNTYYVDLHRSRGTIVDLSVSRGPPVK